MKLHKKKKKDRDRSPSERREHREMGGDDWMIKGREEINKKRKEAEALSGTNRPPEIWVPDKQSRRIRFLSSDPIGAVFQYTLRVGKYFRTVTKPTKDDLLGRSGLTPQLRTFYVVIDIDGYVDKKTGKKMRNLVRFYPVSGRVEKQISVMRDKYGGLRKRVFEVTRNGSGKDTTYMFIPEDREPMSDAQKALKPLDEVDFRKYYAPPTKDQQKAMLSGVSPVSDDDDDEDDD